MAKTMARISNSVVINLEWVNDRTYETDVLRNIYDLQVKIGDEYRDGKFYHNGSEVVSYREQVRRLLASYDNALSEIESYIPSVMTVSEEGPPTIESRKQTILNYLVALVNAVEEGGNV